MTCDLANCYLYRPGDLSQDLWTIPIEAGLLAAATYGIEPPEHPRWPFEHETANGERNPSRQPGYLGGALGAAVFLPLVTHIHLEKGNEFRVWAHIRGLIHTHILTEIFTIGAKNSFGRKRPFYDTERSAGRDTLDDRRSFFSGHASHAFAFALYGSSIAHDYLESQTSQWLYTGLMTGTAAWISASRAVDGQHNATDVLAGSAVGSAVGYFIASRVTEVSKDSQSSLTFNVTPMSFELRLEL